LVSLRAIFNATGVAMSATMTPTAIHCLRVMCRGYRKVRNAQTP
jgi:hypothetical protein